MFYLRPHLKDLSVTLIKARSECLAVFSVNPKALCPRQPRFIGKKSGYICSRNLSPDPTSWCQLIICPLNLIRFSCAKTAGMENRALCTSTRSFAMAVRIDKAHARRHARAHARAQAGAVSARRSVCKIRHSIHLLVLFPATTVTLLYSGDFPTQTCQSRRSASLFFIRFGVPTWLFPLRPHLTFHSPPPSGWQRLSVYAFSPLLHWHGRIVPRTLSEVFQVWPAMLAALKKKKKEAKKQKKNGFNGLGR